MNILLVNPPCRQPSLIPLGLGYIASVLKARGHNVSIMDLNAENKDFSEIEKGLQSQGWDLVGIGGLSTTYGFVKEFSFLCKKVMPETKIVAGNMVSTVHPELLLENSAVDICVIDEGEETIIELAEKIGRFPDIGDVKGIVYKKGEAIIKTARRDRITDLDKLPFPAWDLFPMEVYLNNVSSIEYGRRSINVSTERGCPFQCIYCSRPFGPVVHMRSVDSVIAEIMELKRRYRVEFIEFSDDLFIVKRQWVKDFCEALISRDIGMGWGASARVNLVDEELLKIMKRAGCEILSYGFESGSQKILDNMKKGVRVEQSERAVHMTRRAGITVNGSFMIGMIGETEETVNETVDFIKRTGLSLHRFFYTTPFPKTPIYETAKKMGRIKLDEDAYVSSLGEMYNTLLVNLTDMTDEELKKLKENAEKKIKDNFSFATKMRIAAEEARRISAHIKRDINKEGLLRTLNRSLGKIKDKIIR